MAPGRTMTPHSRTLYAPAIAALILSAALAACGTSIAFGSDAGNNGGGSGGSSGGGSGGGSNGGGSGGGSSAGGSGGGSSAGGSGGGSVSNDAGPGCGSVCFSWLPETATPPPSTPGPVTITYNQCNQYGLDAGVCPSGYSCGAPRTVTAGAVTFVEPTCEGPAGAQHLDLDLPPPVATATAFLVGFELRLNENPWPVATSDAGTGTIYLYNQDTQSQLSVPLPSSSAPFSLPLPAATYTLSSSSSQSPDYPPHSRSGTLVVADAGTAVLDYPGVRFNWELDLDGKAVGALGESEYVGIYLQGAHNQYANLSFNQGQVPQGTLTLEPDTYSVTVLTYSSQTAPQVSQGKVVLDTAFNPSNGSGTVHWNLKTVAVAGTVRLNNKLIAGNYDSIRLIDASGETVDMRIDANGAFAHRVYTGVYTVGYNASNPFGATLLPSGVSLIQPGWTAAPSLSINLSPISVSFTVTINGVKPADGVNDSRGELYAYSPAGTLYLPLTITGPATHTGAMLPGTYNLSLDGDPGPVANGSSLPIPVGEWPVRAGWTVSTTPLAIDLAAHPLNTSFTINGGQAPNDADGGSTARGRFQLQSRTLPAGATYYPDFSINLPLSGALSASAVIPDGDWEATFGGVNPNYPVVPQGIVDLGEIHVGPAVTKSWDLRSTNISGTVTAGGRQLPLPGAGKNRGMVLFSSIEATIEQPVAASGNATYSANVWPGIWTIYWYCEGVLGCDTAAMPRSVSVMTQILVQ